MTKAILELDYIPKSCLDCFLSIRKECGTEEIWVCSGLAITKEVDINITSMNRPNFCPLKIITNTGLTKDKKEILKSVCGTCNSKISLTDVLFEEREKSRLTKEQIEESSQRLSFDDDISEEAKASEEMKTSNNMIVTCEKDSNGKFIPSIKSMNKREFLNIIEESIKDEKVTNHKQTNQNIWELVREGSSRLTNEEIKELNNMVEDKDMES
jgi:hypothetical protein